MSENRPKKKTPEPEISDPRLRRPEAAAPLLRTTQMVMWAGLALLLIALAWWGIARKLTWAPVIKISSTRFARPRAATRDGSAS